MSETHSACAWAIYVVEPSNNADVALRIGKRNGFLSSFFCCEVQCGGYGPLLLPINTFRAFRWLGALRGCSLR